MYARTVVEAVIARVNELELTSPTTLLVTGTAATAFPIGVLASAARNDALRKPRRFMKLNGLLIFFGTPLFE